MWRVGAVCVKEKEEGPAASLQTTGIAGPKKMYQKVAHKTCGGRDTKGTARFRFTQARHLNTSSQPLSKKEAINPVSLCPGHSDAWWGCAHIARKPGLPCPAYLVPREGHMKRFTYVRMHALGTNQGATRGGKTAGRKTLYRKGRQHRSSIALAS